MGVAISNTTATARVSPPASCEITALHLLFGRTRCCAAALSRSGATNCGGLPHSCPISAFFHDLLQGVVNHEDSIAAISCSNWCDFASFEVKKRGRFGAAPGYCIFFGFQPWKRQFTRHIRAAFGLVYPLSALKPRGVLASPEFQTHQQTPFSRASGQCRPALPEDSAF